MGRRPRVTPRGTAPGLQRRAARATSRRGAVCGPHVAQNALFRHVAARGAWGATPRQPAGHYGKWPNWANALEQPPARLRGGLRRSSQASAWGPAVRKDAVWAESLAEGAPWARPGYHQAAGCGLRRCGELRILAPVVTGPYGASLKLPATPGDGVASSIT